MSIIGFGPYDAAAGTFAQVRQTLVAMGYDARVNEGDGFIDFQANYVHRYGRVGDGLQRAEIHVQMYREGMIELTPRGELVVTRSDGWDAPRELGAEVVSVSGRLMNVLGRPQYASRALRSVLPPGLPTVSTLRWDAWPAWPHLHVLVPVE